MNEEKESERRNNLRYDEMVAEGLIIPARNPQRIFTIPEGEISEGKQLSEILIDERRSAEF